VSDEERQNKESEDGGREECPPEINLEKETPDAGAEAECARESGEPPKPESEKAEDKDEKVTVSRRELEELKALAKEREEYLQRLQRAIADKMNMQNRLEKIRESAASDARRNIARKIVPLADSLTRALENSRNTQDIKAVIEGLEMTEKEFYDIMDTLSIKPVKAQGEQFDHNYHEAVYQQPTEEVEPNTVVSELKKGFLIDGKLLRPSQVVVATSPPRENVDD